MSSDAALLVGMLAAFAVVFLGSLLLSDWLSRRP